MTSLSMIRSGLWALVTAAVIIVAMAALGLWPGAKKQTTTADIGAPFTLTATSGETYSWPPAEGGAHAIFFGFTHCPDICPTTLYEMTTWMDALPDKGRSLNALFITVDPERDTPEKLGDYLSAFGDRITGLTGTAKTIEKVTDDFRVYYQKVDLADGGYTMDHLASVLLFRADGSFQGTIAYGENAEIAVEKLTNLTAG